MRYKVIKDIGKYLLTIQRLVQQADMPQCGCDRIKKDHQKTDKYSKSFENLSKTGTIRCRNKELQMPVNTQQKSARVTLFV